VIIQPFKATLGQDKSITDTPSVNNGVTELIDYNDN